MSKCHIVGNHVSQLICVLVSVSGPYGPDFLIWELLIAGYLIYLGPLVKIWSYSVVPKPNTLLVFCQSQDCSKVFVFNCR